jgi:ribosomal-protein-alanine N-acetyltransferase
LSQNIIFMIETKIFDAVNKPSSFEKKELIEFLHNHLQEYGDSKKDIEKAIDYSVKEFASFGGFTLLIIDNNKIVGVTVINKTGMGGYIPENILVYIATHQDYRGKGFGKVLMKKAIGMVQGDIALHVESDNPAKIMYEKLGFTNPYLEMRLKK